MVIAGEPAGIARMKVLPARRSRPGTAAYALAARDRVLIILGWLEEGAGDEH